MVGRWGAAAVISWSACLPAHRNVVDDHFTGRGNASNELPMTFSSTFGS